MATEKKNTKMTGLTGEETAAETVVMTEDSPQQEHSGGWDDMVEIRLPKAPRGQDNYVIASVNGRVFKIRRGEKVSVPAPIAEVLENADRMHDEADRYIEEQLQKSEKREEAQE